MLDVSRQLVGFLVTEHGRTPADAWALDVLPAVDGLHWAARAGKRALAPERIRPETPLARTRRATLVRRPRGVIAVPGRPGSPWADTLQRTAVALMAGNGVLLEATPTGERIMRVFERAGLPERVVSTAGAEALAAADFTWAPEPDDPGPMLVLADADVGRAAAAAAWSAGASLDEAIVVREAAEAFRGRLSAALPSGATAPAVVAVADVEEGLDRAAAHRAHAVASVWSADHERAERIAADLPAALVWINDHGAPVARRSPLLFDAVTHAGVVTAGGWSPWLPPTPPGLDRGLSAVGTLLYGRESDRAGALRQGARPLIALAGRVRRRR